MSVLSRACLVVAVAALVGWEAVVRLYQLPQYLLPGPVLVGKTLWANFGSLMGSWWFTVKITFGALALAIGGLTANYVLYLVGLNLLSPGTTQLVIQVAPILLLAGALMAAMHRGDRAAP